VVAVRIFGRFRVQSSFVKEINYIPFFHYFGLEPENNNGLKTNDFQFLHNLTVNLPEIFQITLYVPRKNYVLHPQSPKPTYLTHILRSYEQ
jgi:hypothetical protein